MASLTGRIISHLIMKRKLNPNTDISLADSRANSEKISNRIKLPKGLTIRPFQIDGLPAEWLIPGDCDQTKTLLYIHGGAFAMNSINSHRGLAARLVDAAGIRALTASYRLAPEHPYPAAPNDCLAVWNWLVEQGNNPSDIVIAGDSAGGTLVLGLLIALKNAGKALPAAAVCLSPLTDLAMTGESVKTKALLDPVLRAPKTRLKKIDPDIIIDPIKCKASDLTLAWYYRSTDPFNPKISPLYADLKGLPTTLFHVGENEILLDDSLRMAARMRDAGVKTELVIWPKMFHVFQIFAPILPEARKSIKMIGKFISDNLDLTNQGTAK